MRYSVRKSGKLAALGQQRATIDDALELALQHLSETKAGEVVTLEDHETGKTYRDEDIRRLAKAVEDGNA
jgi:hypothetical protein